MKYIRLAESVPYWRMAAGITSRKISLRSSTVGEAQW